MLKRVFAFALSLVCVMGLAACSSTPEGSDSGTKEPASSAAANPFPGSAEADTVAYDITSEPSGLNPMTFSDVGSLATLTHAMAGLTRLDANDQPVADIAESWDVSEDGKVYTMHLRKDARWSNGDPVTANDFYFSWVSQLDPATGSMLPDLFYKHIKGAEALYNGEGNVEDLGVTVEDDYTLRVEFATPTPTALFLMSQPTYFPVNQKAYEEIGAGKYGTEAEALLTNGPYRVSGWVHDDHIMLEKDENYFGAADISIPKIKLTMISDSNTRLNAFMAGELDVLSLFSEQIAQVKEQGPEAVSSYVDGGSWFLDFNNENEFLKNANLRRALTYSVDVQSLLDNVVQDDSVVAGGLVPSGIDGPGGKDYATERGSLLSYDLDAAKKYFDQALTELGVTADQITLKLTVHDTTYSQTQAAFVQQQWKQALGLDVAIDIVAYKALTEAKQAGDYEIGIGGWAANENDAAALLETLLSTNPNNVGKYSNVEYDKLLKEALAETDATKRFELLIAAETLLIEDMGVGPLYHTATTYATSAKVEGLVRTPFQLFNFYSDGRIVSAS